MRSVEQLKAEKAAIQRKYRSTPKGIENDMRHKEKQSTAPMKSFVAWDGEGYTDERGIHRYMLLANSRGDWLAKQSGLSTEEALWMLTEGGRVYTESIHVGFSLGYDINMILKDIPYEGLLRLYKTGRLYWKKYSLSYRPRKYLEVRRYKDEVFIKSQTKYLAHIMLWDVFGFFQSSFVEALRSFFKPDELADLQLEQIVSGKADRSVFQFDKLESDILPYCQLECKALVRLMHRLYNEYCIKAGITLKRFDGSGAIAEHFLTRYRVKQFYGYTNIIAGDQSPPKRPIGVEVQYPYAIERHWRIQVNDPHAFNILNTGHRGYIPDELMEASQHGYGGGRIEMMQYGNYEGEVDYEDINSAYPEQYAELPSLTDGVWVHGIGEPPEIFPYTIYKVRWGYEESFPFYPFFYRSWPFLITFPSHGMNWVWWKEVAAARKWQHKFIGGFDILEYWQFIPDKEVFPYTFVKDLYERRRELKAQGNGMEKVYKLGYNSLYGKTVQHLGYEDHAAKEEYSWRPPFYSLQYGGMITSGTRAKIFDACMQHPEDIIAIATDGFWSTKRHSLEEGDGLGQWEHEKLLDMTIAQSGVYWYTKENGKEVTHYRGFDRGSLSRQDVINAWREGRRTLPVKTTRFVTLGLALQLDDFEKWHTWDTSIRELSLYPKSGGKRLDAPVGNWSPHRELVPTIPNSMLVQFNSGDIEISEKFPLPWTKERQSLNELLLGRTTQHLDEWEIED